MKKSKLLILGGLAAGATTFSSIATLVSCGNNENQKPWLSIDQKTITINDGRTGRQEGDDAIQFVFNSSVNIEAGANIEVAIDGDYSEDNDFNVEFEVEEIKETTKQIIVNVKLFGEREDADDIYNDSHATFNVKVQWKGEDGKVLKQQVVKDLKIDFYCQDNEISVLNDGIATTLHGKQTARFIFNLGDDDQIPDKNKHELLVDVDAHPEELSHIEDVELYSWEVNDNNQLVVYFKLIHYLELQDQDNITFDIRMRCVDKATNKVYWDYQNGNVLKINYSIDNTFFPYSQLKVLGADNEVETNTHNYTVYYWDEIKYDEGEISFTAEVDPNYEYKEDVKITLSALDITEYPDVCNIANMTATFTKPDGSPLEQDYDIPFRIKFEIKGHHEITEDEDSGLCTFCYRSKKFNDISSELTQTTLFDDNTSSFDLTLREEPEAGYTFKYNVIADEQQTYTPYSDVHSCVIDETTLSSLVSIKAKSGEKLVNGATGNFALEIIGVDGEGEEQWKQTTDSLLNIKYRSSIDDYTKEYNINNGVLTGEINFTLGDTTSADLAVVADSYDPVEQEHIKEVQFGEITVDGNNGKIPFTLVPRLDLKFDGFIKFNFAVSGRAPDADPWTYTFENVSITYAKGVIIEDKEQSTKAGGDWAIYNIEFKPEWRPKQLDEITIIPEITGSSKDDIVVYYMNQESSYDSEKGILKAYIKMEHSDGKTFLGRSDYANFSLTISTNNMPETTISDLSLEYVPATHEYDTVVETAPGVYDATYKFTFQDEVPTDQKGIEVNFAGEKPVGLDSVEATPDQTDKKVVNITVTADKSTIVANTPVLFKLNIKISDKEAEVVERKELTEEMSFTYIEKVKLITQEREQIVDVSDRAAFSEYATFRFELIDGTVDELKEGGIKYEISERSKATTTIDIEHVQIDSKTVDVKIRLYDKDNKPLQVDDFAKFTLTIELKGLWSQTFDGFKLTVGNS